MPEASTSGGGNEAGVQEPPAAKAKPLPPGMRPYRRVELPTPEQIVQEDFMNNCAVRTVLSGAMGSVLGVMFGLFMGTMDGAVSGHMWGDGQRAAAHAALSSSTTHIFAQGLGIDGRLAGTETQKQTVKQVLRDMARNAGSKSL